MGKVGSGRRCLSLTPDEPSTFPILCWYCTPWGVSDRKVGEVMTYLLGYRYSYTTVGWIAELVLERVDPISSVTQNPMRRRTRPGRLWVPLGRTLS